MGIQSTRHISREQAIERIHYVNDLIRAGNYKTLEENSSEHDYDIEEYLSSIESTRTPSQLWTDGMLEKQMDEPYYRFSMFENYSINDWQYRD